MLPWDSSDSTYLWVHRTAVSDVHIVNREPWTVLKLHLRITEIARGRPEECAQRSIHTHVMGAFGSVRVMANARLQ